MARFSGKINHSKALSYDGVIYSHHVGYEIGPDYNFDGHSYNGYSVDPFISKEDAETYYKKFYPDDHIVWES